MIARQRSEGCLSDLRLDQLLSGELDRAAEQATRAHLATCGACEQRREQLALDRQGFRERVPAFEELVARPAALSSGAGAAQRRASRRWLSLALPAAAVLALGLGLKGLLRDKDESGGADPGVTRTKGSGVSFGFVVRRGERSFAGQAGEVLHPGDLLRFTASSSEPVYAAVWGVDALGRLHSYQERPELARVPAGQRQPLPGAVELDDSLGEERLVAVFCASPRPLVELTRALAAGAATPRLPADCRSESLAIVKVPP